MKTKKRQKVFVRGFINPVADTDYRDERYFQKYSYGYLLKKIQDDIDRGIYIVSHPASQLQEKIEIEPQLPEPFPHNVVRSADLPEDDTARKRLLRHVFLYSPDIFESDNATARGLVAEFGKILKCSRYGKTAAERKTAKEFLKDLIDKKPNALCAKKGYIPPLLSLRKLVEFLHEVTLYLKQKYEEEHDDQTGSTYLDKIKGELKTLDPRLYELAENKRISLLLKKPKELTDKIVAEHFGLTVGGLRQKIKQEPPS